MFKTIFLFGLILIIWYRSLSGGVHGWSRDSVIEITTNIESQELRRRQTGPPDNRPPEHPRAGATDLLEGGFALTRSAIGGDNFTVKQFRSFWRSHCRFV